MPLACVTPTVQSQSDGGGAGGDSSYGGGDYYYDNYGDSSGTGGGADMNCSGDCPRNVGIVFGSLGGACCIIICCYSFCIQCRTPDDNKIHPQPRVATQGVDVQVVSILSPPGGAPMTEYNNVFPTAPCRAAGTYSGHAQSIWNKGSYLTSIDRLQFDASHGTLSGNGSDGVGAFTIQGVCTPASGAFEWIKSYTDSSNQVRYQGQAIGETRDRLQGKWALCHKQDHGTFDMKLEQL